MKPLIAFTGLAGCGKTTAALALVSQAGWGRVSFADPIRDMLRALGVTSHQMANLKNEPLPLLGGQTPRWAMQTLGTEWGRTHISPNLWVNATRARIEEIFRVSEATRGVVLDDCRFANEALMVRSMGGRVVRITRPGLTAMNHASEQGVPDALVDLTIENNHTDLRHLQNDVLYIFNPPTDHVY